MGFTGTEHSPRLLPYDPADRLALDGELTPIGPRGAGRVDESVSPSTPDRLYIEVVELSGRAACVELRVRMDTVEVLHRGHLAAVFDRDALRQWWEEPAGSFQVDDVTWTVDCSVDVRGRAAVTLPTVNAWTLSPQDHDEVTRHLNKP